MTDSAWSNPQQMWDERFAGDRPVYGEEPNDYLRAQAGRLAPGARVLVPGDGYGRNGVWLAKQGFHVHTVDLSPVGVERARNSARAAGLKMTIETADLAAWHWPVMAFDAVVSIFLHLPEPMRVDCHHRMLEALTPGGLVILEAFTPAQLRHCSGGPKQVDLLYTAAMLRRDFADAEVLELEEREVVLAEGHMHCGPAAVVRATFRKS